LIWDDWTSEPRDIDDLSDRLEQLSHFPCQRGRSTRIICSTGMSSTSSSMRCSPGFSQSEPPRPCPAVPRG
jgi:hypothetical protein